MYFFEVLFVADRNGKDIPSHMVESEALEGLWGEVEKTEKELSKRYGCRVSALLIITKQDLPSLCLKAGDHVSRRSFILG